jgi:hypothetical protein
MLAGSLGLLTDTVDQLTVRLVLQRQYRPVDGTFSPADRQYRPSYRQSRPADSTFSPADRQFGPDDST